MPTESFADFSRVLNEGSLSTAVEICTLKWMVQCAVFTSWLEGVR